MKLPDGRCTALEGIYIRQRRKDSLVGISFDAQAVSPVSTVYPLLYRQNNNLYWWDTSQSWLLNTTSGGGGGGVPIPFTENDSITTTGTTFGITSSALTTGNVYSGTASTANFTTGGAIFNANLVAAVAGNGFVATTTGAYTGTGLLVLTANSAQTGTVAAISATALTRSLMERRLCHASISMSFGFSSSPMKLPNTVTAE